MLGEAPRGPSLQVELTAQALGPVPAGPMVYQPGPGWSSGAGPTVPLPDARSRVWPAGRGAAEGLALRPAAGPRISRATSAQAVWLLRFPGAEASWHQAWPGVGGLRGPRTCLRWPRAALTWEPPLSHL